MSRTAELYACIYARDFPAQAQLRLRPALRSRACAVLDGSPPLQQVCVANAAAKALGVEHGMTQVELEAFPAVAVLQRAPDEEATAKAAILDCASHFSPRVEDCSIAGTCAYVIDIAGTGKLFGSPETLACDLLRRICELGIEACIAVSGNFDAALSLAKGLSPEAPVQVIPRGEECTALASLPLMVLDLTAEQKETFALWGISTLGTLAALPEKDLVARLGQEGKRLRQLARGEKNHLFKPLEQGLTLKEHMELDSPIESLDALLFIVRLLLEQVILRAITQLVVLASVTLTLDLDGGMTHSQTVRPALPGNDRQFWLKLLHLDLAAHPPSAAILGATLNAETGSPRVAQLGLFAPQLPEPGRLDLTLARIRAVVGEENAGRAVLQDTHQPDRFRVEPFSIPAAQTGKCAAVPARPAMRWLRPMVTVSVTCQDTQPAAFVFRAARYTVARAYGPWQSSGEWWNPMHWAREEWDVIARTRDGAMLYCCLARDLIHAQWQMVALYD